METSTSNNSTDSPQAITVTTRPNLVPTAISCPASITTGVNFDCTVTVENQGNVTAAAFVTDLRLSTNNIISTGDALVGTCNFGSIVVGGSQTVTCTGNATSTPGNYFVGARADSANAVVESSETDNAIASAGTVTLN